MGMLIDEASGSASCFLPATWVDFCVLKNFLSAPYNKRGGGKINSSKQIYTSAGEMAGDFHGQTVFAGLIFWVLLLFQVATGFQASCDSWKTKDLSLTPNLGSSR